MKQDPERPGRGEAGEPSRLLIPGLGCRTHGEQGRRRPCIPAGEAGREAVAGPAG